MIYSEAAYFHGYHFHHIAAYHEHLRHKRRAETMNAVMMRDRRKTTRFRFGRA